MPCLHCGKDLPLLKRLSGGEFCSEAHRLEYQQEYTQMALKRLRLAKPRPLGEPTPESLRETPRTEPAAAQNGTAAQNGAAKMSAPPIAKPAVPAPQAQAQIKPTPPPVPRPRPKPSSAPKVEDTAPAAIAGNMTQKPPAASMRAAARALPEDQMFSTQAVLVLPQRETPGVSLGLVQADAVDWDPGCEIRESAAHVVEVRVELRNFLPLTPVIHLGMSVTGPHAWDIADESVDVPVMNAVSPDAPAPWQAPACDFSESIVMLCDFADVQLSVKESAAPPAGAPRPEELIPDAAAQVAPQPPREPSIPNLAVESIPVVPRGIPAGKARPAQVFASSLLSGFPIQVPNSEALPLRPRMVLGQTEAAKQKTRKADVRILAPEKPVVERPVIGKVTERQVPPPIEPARVLDRALAEPVPVSLARPVPQFDIGLPPLRVEASGRSIPPNLWKIIAGGTGALLLALGVFLFAGTKHASLPKPVTVAAADWIADFAPDTKRQRKISVLRSPAAGSDYRVEFESAIQIKALGWVYRAQDPKNFYVGKIELQKPGLDPTYVVAHYAVINGIDQPRTEVPLRVQVPVGGNYRIHFEAAGDRFTTWVQDQKADEWTDARLKTGGAGLYSEGIEQSNLNGVFHVTPLDKKK